MATDIKQLGHAHICPNCYRRIQFTNICSRCGGLTVPEPGNEGCCR